MAHTVMTPCNKNEVMSENLTTKDDPGQPMIYEVRLEGHLDRQWTDWFGGMALKLEDNGVTVLTGQVVDQAALHGLLRKVRDLGVPLVSVIRVNPHLEDASDAKE